MLVSGLKDKCMEMENFSGKMDHHIKDSIDMGKNMGQESLYFLQVTFTKDFGVMVNKMEEEFYMTKTENK